MEKKTNEPEVVERGSEKLDALLTMPPDASALMALSRAEFDAQSAIAVARPRSVSKFKAAMLEMATLDEDTAEGMYYTLPRGEGVIQGPSVRLAEIAVVAWGNLRQGSRVVEVGSDYVAARGVCLDLENNLYFESDVRRNILNKYGKRYNADMIAMTGRAACAIAKREAAFNVIPRVYINLAMREAMRVVGEGLGEGEEKLKSFNAKRTAALAWFEQHGVDNKAVYRFCEVKGKDELAGEHLAKLAGIRNAVRDNEATLDSFFGAASPATAPPGTLSVEGLAGAAVRAENDAKHTPEPAPEPPRSEAPPRKGASSLFE